MNNFKSLAILDPLLCDARKPRPVRSGPRAGLPRVGANLRRVAEVRVDVAPNLQVRLRDAQVAVSPSVLRELGGVGARAVGERREVAVVAAHSAAAASVCSEALEDHGGPAEALDGEVDVCRRRTRGRVGQRGGLVRRNRGVPEDGRVLDSRVEEVFEGRQHRGGGLVVDDACARPAGGPLSRGHGGVAEDGGPREGQVVAESAAVLGFREVVTLGTADLGGSGVVAGGCVGHDSVLGAGREGEEEAGADG